MRLTISDIAKKTGYAKSTVSAALNNKPGVKPKTREEIQRIAAEMNYIPNEFARNLSMQTTNTIGIIVRDITNPFTPRSAVPLRILPPSTPIQP